MGRVKEYMLKKQEEDWIDEIINEKLKKQNNIIFHDLFNFDDLKEFYMMEIHLIDGSVHCLHPENIHEISGINIKWTEPAQLHKGDNIKQTTALISVPICQISHMITYYE